METTIKIGDEVICLKKDTYAPKGTTGKVVAIDKIFGYLIKWNRNVGGFGDEINKIPYGFGEYMQDFQIEKIVKVQTKKIVPEKIKSKDEIIEGLKKELALTKKALELACETYWNDCGMEDCPDDIMDGFSDKYKKCKTCPNGGDRFVNDKGCCWVDYFKAKAKEMKSE